MVVRKDGFPEEDELVLCTITNIQYHSVFADLDEYKKSGMIHISEIAPGRIRNIRDFVKEGKKVVCKVLKISKDKGHIDLSLRRVNDAQKRNKLNEIKQSQLTEKIIEFVAKKAKTDFKELHKKLSEKILQEYDSLFDAFEDVSLGDYDLSDTGVDKVILEDLIDTIKQRIKPREVIVRGEITLQSYESDGVQVIHEAVAAGRKVKGDFSISYLGAGKYNIVVTSKNYKDAEKVLNKVTEEMSKIMDKRRSKFKFERCD